MRLYSLSAFLLAFLAAFLLSTAAHAQATRTVTRTVELSPDGHLLLDTYKGRMDVSTWDRDAVQVEVQLEADEQELVDNTEVRFESSSRRLEISEEVSEENRSFLQRLFGSGGRKHPAAYYTIRMPRTAQLTIDAYSSDIRVADLEGDLTLDTYSGDAEVQGLGGRISADTYSGDVRVENAGGAAEIDTYSGDAEISFRVLTGSSSFDSYSGDVTLYLPARAGFELVADLGRGGDLEADFPTDALRVDDNEFRGIVGEGGPRLQFDTYSGDLRLRRQ